MKKKKEKKKNRNKKQKVYKDIKKKLTLKLNI
jgi:hypothetical protein